MLSNIRHVTFKISTKKTSLETVNFSLLVQDTAIFFNAKEDIYILQ